MEQQHGSSVGVGLPLIFMVIVGTALAWQPGHEMLVNTTAGRAEVHARSLAAITGFGQGELPSGVQVSNSRYFDGFYQNGGSSQGKDNVRTSFAFKEDTVLYYNPARDEWVFSSPGKTARCRPPEHAVLPERGLWKLSDGSTVQIEITGYDVRAGKTFTTNMEKLDALLDDIEKPSDISFHPGVDVDGKQWQEDATQKPSTSVGGTAGATTPDKKHPDQTDGEETPDQNGRSNHTADSNRNGSLDDSQSVGSKHPNSDQNGRSNRTAGLDDSFIPNQTNSSSSRSEDAPHGIPLGYKILLFALALSSLICACLCTAGGFLCLGVKEGLEGRRLVPDGGSSDTEDPENDARPH